MRINNIRFKERNVVVVVLFVLYFPILRGRHSAILKVHDLWRLYFFTFFSIFRFFFFNTVYGMKWRIILVIDILDTPESFMIVKYAKKLSADKS